MYIFLIILMSDNRSYMMLNGIIERKRNRRINMNVKQKLGYMLIGCLFTIAGYILASLGGVATHAQQNEQVIDKVICRELQVVNKDGKRGVILFTTRNGNGVMGVFNNAGEEVAILTADQHGGVMEFHSNTGNKIGVIGASEVGGVMGVLNNAQKRTAGFAVDGDGNGVMEVFNNAGMGVVGIGSFEHGGVMEVLNIAGEPTVRIITTEKGNGVIQTYKGDWRTH